MGALKRRTVARDDFAFVTAGKLRHVIQVVGGEVHLDLGQGEDFTLLLSNDSGQRLAVGANQRRNLPQMGSALDGGKGGPGLLRPLRGPDSAIHILDSAVGKFGNDLFGGGVHYRKGFGRSDKFAVDQHLIPL